MTDQFGLTCFLLDPIFQSDCHKLPLHFTLYLFADDLHLEPCCQYEFYRMKSYLPAEEEEKEKDDEFGPNSIARLRKFVWELFEEPNKTKLAKVLLLAL